MTDVEPDPDVYTGDGSVSNKPSEKVIKELRDEIQNLEDTANGDDRRIRELEEELAGLKEMIKEFGKRPAAGAGHAGAAGT